MLKWSDFDANSDGLRQAVRGAIEEAAGASVSVDDPTCDELIAIAQQYDVPLMVLKTWIYDMPKPEGFTPGAFVRWARAHAFLAEDA